MVSPKGQTYFVTITLLIGVNLIAIPMLSSAPQLQKSQSSSFVETVRHGTTLCSDELAVIDLRKPKIHNALQSFLKKSIDHSHVPTIALACSGGGTRAAIATLGVLRGLEKIGLLDALTYTAGVSGSTWTLASWMYHKQMNLDNLTIFLKEKIAQEFSFKNIDVHALERSIKTKQQHKRPVSFADVWATLLTQVFLNTPQQNGFNVSLDHLAPQVCSGSYPIPFLTTIIGQTSPHHQWAEFSPFEIGSPYLNTWVHPSAFGKLFKGDTSIDVQRGESLGYLLAICGSAYAFNPYEAWSKINHHLKKTYGVCIDSSLLSRFFDNKTLRFSAPHINNFALNDAPPSIKNQQYLTFIDAGITCNLPIPPLLRRSVDVYIVCDASRHISPMNQLQNVEAYAQKYGYAFPPIDYKKIASNRLNIFIDHNSVNTPVVIYIPNFVKFPTTKLSYTHKQFDLVLDGIERAVIDYSETIKSALDVAIAKKCHMFK